MSKRRKPADEVRRIDQLRAFPSQREVFDDLCEQELQDLAADIAERGLQEKIEVLPQNSAGFELDTVIKGHQRIRALRLLGRTETVVRVRHDLANASKPQIEAEFVKSNIRRRQLTTLQSARAEAFLYWSNCKPQYRVRAAEDQELAKRIAVATGATGRHLKRILRILDAPLPVQRACDAGRLRMVLAERVGSLPEQQQQEIAKRIDGGDDAREVVGPYFSKPTASIEQVVQHCMHGLSDAMALLEGRLIEIDEFQHPGVVRRHCRTLDRCRRFAAALKSALQASVDDGR
jgi:ParB-like chromosome segregation protein Spo0J